MDGRGDESARGEEADGRASILSPEGKKVLHPEAWWRGELAQEKRIDHQSCDRENKTTRQVATRKKGPSEAGRITHCLSQSTRQKSLPRLRYRRLYSDSHSDSGILRPELQGLTTLG